MDNDTTVTEDEAQVLWETVNEGMHDEGAGNLAEGDALWVGIVHNDGAYLIDGLRPGSYGLECNDYGQMAQYRFLSRETALLWFQGVTADFA